MKRIAFCGALFVGLCVHADPFRLIPLDIFKNDSVTRYKADEIDIRWTVSMGRCTASMLSTKYLLTANHCSVAVGEKFTSGGCLFLGCRNDLKVVRVAERYSDFDSDIAEVEWLRQDSRWRQRYTPRVQTMAADITLGKDGIGTKLFTVGFPGDKPTAMVAYGYAKSRDGQYLNYNVGSINGNSGGAVWTWDSYMLVSQTNHGAHSLGEAGWNNNDPEDQNAWNGGPQMDLLYKKSSVLKEVFPTGQNYNVSFEGFLIHDDILPPLDP